MVVSDTSMCPGFLTPVLTYLNFPFHSHILLPSYASGVRDKKSPERKFAATGYRTCSLQITCQISHPTRPPDRAECSEAAVDQLLERPPREREVVGLIFGRNRPKSSKLVVVAFPLGVQDYGNSTMTGPPVSG